ncbi:hypothetical protein TD95_002224 [Thielaviopsis punctulata]|uniref:Uncharacterized protein n=1 Tax=Thielaviopsis punctulata TaxID=72032 RepID=A0A0F4ZJH3_9PEZI|nr:hypothetical protein TD95_002224 [Thielaviopsis punctulata]
MSVFSFDVQGNIAVITINRAAKLNALDQLQYFELGRLLQEIATLEDVCVTVLVGTGRFFSAGADVNSVSTSSMGTIPNSKLTRAEANEAYRQFLTTFGAYNLNLARSFYTHPKILVFGLNGPAIGLSGALAGLADFVYCTPQTFLLMPFSSLGLVAEGTASHALVRRMGVAKANEALIMGKKIVSEELKACGFVNEVFDVGGDDAAFRERVMKEVRERFAEHVNKESLLHIKKLIRGPEIAELDKANIKEVFGGIERFMKGVPQTEFGRVARGEKRHKL